MPTGSEEGLVLTWMYWVIGGLGTIFMGIATALNCRISGVADDADSHITELSKRVDGRIDDSIKPIWESIRNTLKLENDRAIENERRYALKDDVREIKEHMDLKFAEISKLMMEVLTGRNNHAS